MDETIVDVENYEEVVGGFDNSPFQSDYRTGDAAPFKDPHQTEMIMASMLRPALRNSNLSLAEEARVAGHGCHKNCGVFRLHAHDDAF